MINETPYSIIELLDTIINNNYVLHEHLKQNAKTHSSPSDFARQFLTTTVNIPRGMGTTTAAAEFCSVTPRVNLLCATNQQRKLVCSRWEKLGRSTHRISPDKDEDESGDTQYFGKTDTLVIEGWAGIKEELRVKVYEQAFAHLINGHNSNIIILSQ